MSNTMANKNPFEIRSEMLQLAKDYMDQQYHMNREFAEKMFEAGKVTMEQWQEANKPGLVVQMITGTQIGQ